MAYPRDYHIDRLLSSYDVLYNGHRLDASLFLYDGHRTVSGTGCRRCIRTVYHNAEQTSDHGLLDGGSCLRRRICLLRGLQNGLEKVTKVMMTSLLIIMIILAVNSFFMDGAKEGFAFI